MDITFRKSLVPADRDGIREVLESTDFFYDYEVKVALEIFDDFLRFPERNEYYFIIAEQDGRIIGYVNFGPSPCTQSSWDIYWIAVRKDIRNNGLGKNLLKQAESFIKTMEGMNIWVETSGRKSYDPTRGFYLKSGYVVETELKDYYAPGDNKVIFHKILP